MRWTVHGERSLYESEWVRLRLVDVEPPGERRFEHHVVRMDRPAAGVVVHRIADDTVTGGAGSGSREVLLLWRHRFITDSWGWEIPAGKVDDGEDAPTAAAREVLEETGWRCGPVSELTTYEPVSGVGDHRFVLFQAEGAVQEGDPTDPSEAERIEWVSVDRLFNEEIPAQRCLNGLTLTALLWCRAYGIL
jgi:8-oxo-dGTP pyrophosphatase MutT (NUDIX family)